MRKPNFFIVGAPKCGTTALYTYLRKHPAVFLPKIKEPHFFASDLRVRERYMHDLEEYLRLFKKANEKHLAVGEASVFYMFSKVAIPRIREFNPQAKLIAMVRNPLEMIHSYHNQLLFSHFEEERDIEKAWRLQDARLRGDHVPLLCQEPKMLFYRDIAKQGEQVERMLQSFPPDQVKIIVFDDFKSSVRSVYNDVLEFLGVPSDGRVDFPPVNVSKVHRSERLARFLRRPPALLDMALRGIKKVLRVRGTGLGKLLLRANTRQIKREPLAPTFRWSLLQEFREDVNKLSRLLNRDLNHWLT